MWMKATGLSLAALMAASSVHAQAEPCAQVSDLFAKSSQLNSTFEISGDLAHRCMLSMPIEAPQASSFIDEYRKYLQFQSTIDVLQDPPSEYPMPAADLLGGLDRIQDNIRKGKYSSQYEVDTDLQLLIQSANDGHLYATLCSTTLWDFIHGEPLVSISSDGLKLPQVFTLSDAKALGKGGQDVSPIKSINGTDVAKYMEKFTSLQSVQDPDAQYNLAFPSLSRTKVPNGLWTSNSIWPGPSLDLQFDNGTVRNVETRATAAVGSFNFRNGTALYERFCSAKSLRKLLDSLSSSSTNSTSAAAGYPEPNSSSANGLTFGYLSNQNALRDTAILSIPTFSGLPSITRQFAASFLRNATAAGKKKVIVDLSGNPGGMIFGGIGLFQMFFPGEPIYIGSRFRAHPAVDFIGRSFAHQNESAQLDSLLKYANPFTYKKAVTPDQKGGFASWKELYGPHEILGANTSSLTGAFNFTAFLVDGHPNDGYEPAPGGPAKPLFAPEDITIVTDGYCASTCTVFIQLMKSKGVRSIAFGGRPRHAPMQAMGGVKGSQSVTMTQIYTWIKMAHELVAKSLRTPSPIMSREEWKQYNETLPIPPENLAVVLLDGGVNLRDAYVESDTETPLQFVYEAAECRLFYTLENYLHQESVWSAAANAMFGNGTCVDGSTGGKGSLDEK